MSEQAGIDAVHEFVNAFNAQDHERIARSMNYPHIRLAGGRFQTIEDAAQFAAQSIRYEPMLRAEGWVTSKLANAEVIHATPDKVHLALEMLRLDKNGETYNSFQTFWIATLQDGHWGIQFRSSYL